MGADENSLSSLFNAKREFDGAKLKKGVDAFKDAETSKADLIVRWGTNTIALPDASKQVSRILEQYSIAGSLFSEVSPYAYLGAKAFVEGHRFALDEGRTEAAISMAQNALVSYKKALNQYVEQGKSVAEIAELRREATSFAKSASGDYEAFKFLVDTGEGTGQPRKITEG